MSFTRKNPFNEILLDRLFYNILEETGDEMNQTAGSFIRLIFPTEAETSKFKWRLLDTSEFTHSKINQPFFDRHCAERNALVFPPKLITNIRR